MPKITHDVKPGNLNFCQICNSKNLKLIINLGKQPLADTLLSKKIDPKKIKKYPLKLVRCCKCSCSQLSYVVSGSKVYHKKYPYRAGITKTLKDYQKKLSAKLCTKYRLNKKSFVIDIGSNDGTLLEGFKTKTKILGIEPTNTAKIANKNGIKTIQNFINEGLAIKIVKKYGKADLITATNVFAHMADLGRVIRSIEILLKNNGHFILENHYLLDIIKDLQFDTIYHEHIRNYSLKSLLDLFSYYKLKIVHAERASRYGGNIRVHIAKDLDEKTSFNIEKLLSIEKKFGLYNDFSYKKSRKSCPKQGTLQTPISLLRAPNVKATFRDHLKSSFKTPVDRTMCATCFCLLTKIFKNPERNGTDGTDVRTSWICTLERKGRKHYCVHT